MATIIRNQDLYLGNDNESILSSLESFLLIRNKAFLNGSLQEMRDLIKLFGDNGIEIGLCTKYNTHNPQPIDK